MRRRVDILAPTLGVYTDRPALGVPRRGLVDARNVRVRDGRIERRLMGWDPFHDIVLGGTPLLIALFSTRSDTKTLILGDEKDLYRYDPVDEAVYYITPRYETGTIITNAASNLVAGPASWTTNLKVGDYIHLGASGETDPEAAWVRIEELVSDTVARLATVAGVTSLNLAYTVRKVFTGTKFNPWIHATYFGASAPDYDLFYATNGVDAPIKWNGNDDQVELLTSLGFTCRWVSTFKGMMIYGDLTESGERKADVIRASAIGEPDNVTTNGAAELNGTALSDVLVGAKPLGDFLVTYGNRGTVNLLQFVGPPLVFVVRTVSAQHGAVSGRAIVDRGDFHEVLGVDGLYRFDGAGFAFIGGQVFDDVVRAMDASRHEQAIGFLDREDGRVLWVVPRIDDAHDPATATPVTGYQGFYLEPVGRAPMPVIPRDLPATALGEFERGTGLRFSDIVGTFIASGMKWNDRFLGASFPEKLMGTADGAIYTLGSSDAQDGAAFAAYARFNREPAGDGSSTGLLTRIELGAEVVPDASYELTVRVLGADRAESPAVELASESYALDESGPRWIAPRALSRFLEIEARTDGANESWSISAMRLTLESGGDA